ncbi:16S rRNA (guanine(966)-N(2))-methyltransferase RsmD [Helicobacter baculiformis]|uniref:16S rRNA (Guanine(966)-N(2))-methyltransferase RsmD n=1 Tax=Helicobacter baculiformis TaxID=427351 RepID=A0ABV7ZH30_9HELI|nr:16S rRNA (guanine(966)-N(2))-methyltransferase RsmD [Helicobacter baculiformis]
MPRHALPVLRILSGACKGLALRMPSKQSTRPTKAVVRASLLNVLRPVIATSGFVEVFGGSGSVGLEALSGGAQEALFFEQDLQVFALLQENIRAFEERYKKPLRVCAIQGDSLALLPQYINSLSAPQIIVYLDPPFNMPLQNCFACVERMQIPPSALIIFEHQSQESMPRNLTSFSIIKQTRFGRTSLSYYANH